MTRALLPACTRTILDAEGIVLGLFLARSPVEGLLHAPCALAQPTLLPPGAPRGISGQALLMAPLMAPVMAPGLASASHCVARVLAKHHITALNGPHGRSGQ